MLQTRKNAGVYYAADNGYQSTTATLLDLSLSWPLSRNCMVGKNRSSPESSVALKHFLDFFLTGKSAKFS